MTIGTRGLVAAPSRPANPTQTKVDRGLEKAAHDFETIFTQRLVEAMRKPSEEESSQSNGMLDHLMNESLAAHLSKGRGVGIASFLYRQWTGDELGGTPRTPKAPPLAPGKLALPASRMGVPAPLGLPAPLGRVPDLEYDPGSVDDGTRPLREMLPPTGLETGPVSSSDPAPDGAGVRSQGSEWTHETDCSGGPEEIASRIGQASRFPNRSPAAG